MGLYADRKAAGKCVQCGYRDPEPGKTKCGTCREKKSHKQKRQREEAIAAGKCRCGEELDDPQFKQCAACRTVGVRNSEEFRRKNSAYNRSFMRRIFLAALNAYGGPVCKCCGEGNIFFLTLDHVNNDGAEHRRETGGVTGKNLAWWLKKNGYPPGFQVLCFNCNCGRARNGGVCPHHGETKWL